MVMQILLNIWITIKYLTTKTSEKFQTTISSNQDATLTRLVLDSGGRKV